MDRWFSDRPVYARPEQDAADLVKIADGVTHYAFEFEPHMVGERLMHELHAAGVPETAVVVQIGGIDEDGRGPAEVRFPGDDEGRFADLIARTIDAHKGTGAPDHRALLEVHQSITGTIAEYEKTGTLSQAERDFLLVVAAKAQT